MKNLVKLNLDLSKELKNILNKDDQYTIPVFIPHLGCKNECVFCNQRKISGNIVVKSINEIRTDIDEYLKYCIKNKRIQIAFFGGSFTGISLEDQIKYLQMANEYIDKGLVDSIRISTRPDYINVEILKILKKYNVKTIELGVQSMDYEVLNASRRGHTALDVIKAARLINLFGIELGFQIMVGLPESNSYKEVETINKLLKFNPKQLRIYPVYVLEESKLYDMYLNKLYTPLSIEEATNRTVEIIKNCDKSNVQIIRIGLQSTEEICSKNHKIIGPVCDNFAEFVLSKIVLEKIEYEIIKVLNEYIKNNKKSCNIVEVYCNKKYFSIVTGPRKVNKKYLESKYDIKLKMRGE